MQLIATVGTKGGTGKSSICLNLAVAAARNGKSVLLIDGDSQRSALFWEHQRSCLNPVTIPLLSRRIHEVLPSLVESHDVVIIDCGGGRQDSSIMRSAILACGKGIVCQEGGIVLVPIQPSQVDLWGLADTIEILEEARSITTLESRLVLNQVNSRTALLRNTLAAIKGLKDLPLLDSRLCSRVAYKNAIEIGLGVVESEPRGKAAAEVMALWTELNSIHKAMLDEVKS